MAHELLPVNVNKLDIAVAHRADLRMVVRPPIIGHFANEQFHRPLTEAASMIEGLDPLEAMPIAADSHARILDKFLQEISLDGRLRAEVADRLRSYKNFRHRFVHGYGFEPAWEVAEEPLRLIPETVALLSQVWRHWLEVQPED